MRTASVWVPVISNCSLPQYVCSRQVQNSQENTFARVSFLIKLQDSAFNIIKTKAVAQVVSCEFCETFKNTFFTEHLWTSACDYKNAAQSFLLWILWNFQDHVFDRRMKNTSKKMLLIHVNKEQLNCEKGFLIHAFCLSTIILNSRSSCPEVFCKRVVFRKFAQFTGKHLCHGLFFHKVAGCFWIKVFRQTLKGNAQFVQKLTFEQSHYQSWKYYKSFYFLKVFFT